MKRLRTTEPRAGLRGRWLGVGCWLVSLDALVLKALSGSWEVLMRCIASALFLLAHGLLVLEHVAVGTALHGVAELFLAPWALRHRAWDIIVIGIIFCVFDLWGTVRLTMPIG